MTRRHLATTLAVLALSACSDDRATVPVAALVEIERSRFGTAELVVPSGTTVTVVNRDPHAHTVTSVEEAPVAFDSGDLAEGDTFDITFEEPGEYRYFCRIHPTMRAVVIVT